MNFDLKLSWFEKKSLFSEGIHKKEGGENPPSSVKYG